MGLRQRLATTDDLPEIGRIVAAAFHPSTDAITRRLFPPHLESLDESIDDGARLWRQARKTASFDDERNVMTVVVDDALSGQVVGFSLWERPVMDGSEHIDPVKKEPKSYTSKTLDEAAFKEMKSVVNSEIERRLGEKGTSDKWHLDYIGVDPRHQRRGIGKMLLNWGIERAEADKKDCYLIATPAGRPLYLNAGFEDLGTVDIFGVPHYSMIRTAKKEVAEIQRQD